MYSYCSEANVGNGREGKLSVRKWRFKLLHSALPAFMDLQILGRVTRPPIPGDPGCSFLLRTERMSLVQHDIED